MKPPFRYYGAKGKLADWIVSVMPEHSTYLEPFAGSAAVLFAKPPSRHEVLNDLDGNVVNFFRILRTREDELIAQLERTPYARDEFMACRDALAAGIDDDLERARCFYVQCQQSFAATTRPNTGWVASTSKRVNRAKSFCHYTERLPAVRERLRRVIIDSRPAVEVIDLYAKSSTDLVYCDPPYLRSTRSERSSTTQSHGYRVEMDTDEAHIELAGRLMSTPAAVLISGYPSDLYEDLYAGWARLDVSTYAAAARGQGNTKVDDRRTEVLWSNRPIHDGRLPL